MTFAFGGRPWRCSWLELPNLSVLNFNVFFILILARNIFKIENPQIFVEYRDSV